MSNVISMREYIHNREHSQMGSGPMDECAICKSQGFGNAPILTADDIKKYIAIGIISSIVGGIVSELVVRRLIFGKKNA